LTHYYVENTFFIIYILRTGWAQLPDQASISLSQGSVTSWNTIW